MKRSSNLRQSISLIGRRMSQALPLRKKKKKPIETSKSLLQDFSEHTTLLGVAQVLRKRNYFWILAYGFCMIMSIVQSWGVARQFFDETTTQKFIIVNKRRLPFPAITICSNTLLPQNFNMSLIPNYVKTTSSENCNIDEQKTASERINELNTEAVLKFLRYNNTEEERQKLSVKIEDFVSSCVLDSKPCNYSSLDDVYIFNNPAYGNCLTINPAINSISGKEVDLNGYLWLMLNFRHGYRMYNERAAAVLYIHTAGTAPILDSPETLKILPERNVQIGIQLIERKFFRKRVWMHDHPTCVYEDEEPYQTSSLFYNEKTPYLYSMAACLKSCDQKSLAKEPCFTIDHSLPITEIELQGNFSIQLPRNNTCEDLIKSDCNCPIPCRLLRYGISFDTTDIESERCETSHVHSNTNRTRIRVAFSASVYELMQEELKHSLTEFLGILGGNMSLWIGLCFLSVLELVELSWNLLRVWPKERKLKEQVKKKNQLSVSPPNNSYEKLYTMAATTKILNSQQLNPYPRRAF